MVEALITLLFDNIQQKQLKKLHVCKKEKIVLTKISPNSILNYSVAVWDKTKTKMYGQLILLNDVEPDNVAILEALEDLFTGRDEIIMYGQRLTSRGVMKAIHLLEEVIV